MPLVYAVAVLLASLGLLKLGALFVMTRVLWLAVIALASLAVLLAVYAIHLRRKER